MDVAVGWVDIALIAVLALSILVGLARGFGFEVLSLAGWFAAYFAAHWLAPLLAPELPVGRPGSSLNYGAAFAIVFIVTLIVWSIGAALVRRLLHATPLSLIDRLLGAAFGLARGVVVLLVVATLIEWTPVNKSPAWRESQARPFLAGMLRGLRPVLPVEITRLLPA